MSGKGGVGKSTVASNLAINLAELGHTVGFMDTDFHGPNTLKMLGIERERVLNEEGFFLSIVPESGLKIMSIAGLLEGRETAVIWRGLVKIGVIRKFLGVTAWGDLDYLVIDASP